MGATVQAKYHLPIEVAERLRLAAVTHRRSYSCLASQLLREGLDRIERGESRPADGSRRRRHAPAGSR